MDDPFHSHLNNVGVGGQFPLGHHPPPINNMLEFPYSPQPPRMAATGGGTPTKLDYMAGDIPTAMANLSLQQSVPRGFNLSATEFYPKPTSSGAISYDVTPVSSPRVNRTRSPAIQSSPHPPNMNDPQYHEGTMYFYSGENEFANQHEPINIAPSSLVYPNYVQYTSEQPHLAHMAKHPQTSLYFINDNIRRDLLSRQSQILAEVNGPITADVPEECDKYCNITPLEFSPTSTYANNPYSMTCYKATNKEDGAVYCLRRIHNFKPVSFDNLTLMKAVWKKISHPNIVSFREVFTTKSFGDASLVLVYDYLAGAETLVSKFLSNPNATNGYNSIYNMDGQARPYSAGKHARKQSHLLPEESLWTFAIQLTSALLYLHSKNKPGQVCYSVSSLVSSKVLVTDQTRLRINFCGLIDILSSSSGNMQSSRTNYDRQKEDIEATGHLLLQLACGTQFATKQEFLSASLDSVKRNYSPHLYDFIMKLLKPGEIGHAGLLISQYMQYIGPRFYANIETLELKVDSLEDQLMRECESSRLFRVMTKLNSILDRQAEPGRLERWSETGDRYILKLFRDYVFHQKTDIGKPWINMAHIVSCMNKLDAGTSEKICLNTPQMNTVIVVSYAELKKYFDSSFRELLTGTGTT